MEKEWMKVARRYDEIWNPDTKFDLDLVKYVLAKGDQHEIYFKIGLWGVLANTYGLNEDLYLAGIARVGESAKLLRAVDDTVLFEFVSNYIAEMQKGEEFAEVTCKKACSACCHQEVLVHNFEANIIAKYIGDHPFFTAERPFPIVDWNQLDRHAQWSRRATGDGNYGWGNTKDLKKLRCPMLGEDGLCNIYEVRPIVCRNYVVKTDPIACDLRNDLKPKFMMHGDFGRLLIVLLQFDMPVPIAHAIKGIEKRST